MDHALDHALDYGLDYGLNFGLDFGLDSRMYELNSYSKLPGLPSFRFLIGSSLLPKFKIRAHFTAY